MRILITGAGGSIGSALAEKLSADNDLILFDSSEYALYKISEKLKDQEAVLGDIKDRDRLSRFIGGVDAVYHCAAYKHVPLLEGDNAEEAWKNNVQGTETLLEVSKDVSSFVLLSTDKAINPVSQMGKSKLEAERLSRSFGRTVARLGNILESSGSVIPKFRKQIANGGPVTVTHPEVTRYFVDMDKAINFLINCSLRAPDTYMVDMEGPKRILDIAKEMIGDRDIEIVFTGLRPGEKLHEELAA